MTPDAADVLAAANIFREILRPLVERLDAIDAQIAALERRPGAFRGPWEEGVTYQVNDGVQWGGHYWICRATTREQPVTGCAAWRICTSRGKPGREGKRGPAGPQGPPGPSCRCAEREMAS